MCHNVSDGGLPAPHRGILPAPLFESHFKVLDTNLADRGRRSPVRRYSFVEQSAVVRTGTARFCHGFPGCTKTLRKGLGKVIAVAGQLTERGHLDGGFQEPANLVSLRYSPIHVGIQHDAFLCGRLIARAEENGRRASSIDSDV